MDRKNRERSSRGLGMVSVAPAGGQTVVSYNGSLNGEGKESHERLGDFAAAILDYKRIAWYYDAQVLRHIFNVPAGSLLTKKSITDLFVQHRLQPFYQEDSFKRSAVITLFVMICHTLPTASGLTYDFLRFLESISRYGSDWHEEYNCLALSHYPAMTAAFVVTSALVAFFGLAAFPLRSWSDALSFFRSTKFFPLLGYLGLGFLAAPIMPALFVEGLFALFYTARYQPASLSMLCVIPPYAVMTLTCAVGLKSVFHDLYNGFSQCVDSYHMIPPSVSLSFDNKLLLPSQDDLLHYLKFLEAQTIKVLMRTTHKELDSIVRYLVREQDRTMSTFHFLQLCEVLIQTFVSRSRMRFVFHSDKLCSLRSLHALLYPASAFCMFAALLGGFALTETLTRQLLQGDTHINTPFQSFGRNGTECALVTNGQAIDVSPLIQSSYSFATWAFFILNCFFVFPSMMFSAARTTSFAWPKKHEAFLLGMALVLSLVMGIRTVLPSSNLGLALVMLILAAIGSLPFVKVGVNVMMGLLREICCFCARNKSLSAEHVPLLDPKSEHRQRVAHGEAVSMVQRGFFQIESAIKDDAAQHARAISPPNSLRSGVSSRAIAEDEEMPHSSTAQQVYAFLAKVAHSENTVKMTPTFEIFTELDLAPPTSPRARGGR